MYIFRADGNAKIGAGHLMRCMTIAEALADLLGGRDEILFVCADEQSGETAMQNGWKVHTLHSDYRNMESEPGIETWLPKAEYHQNVVLADSYFVTDEYLKKLRRQARVFLLDDMQNHTFPVDGVINYNIFAKEEAYAKRYQGTGTSLYIGGSFVPVRKQFQNQGYTLRKEVKDVLLTTGGGDIDNIAGQILERIYNDKLNYHLIIGRFNPHFQKMKQLEANQKGIHIHHDVKDMAGLMNKCDIAVTAGGTTIYELAAIGVPFVCFSYAENQELLTEYIGKQEIAGFAGAYHREPDKTLQNIEMLFQRLCKDSKFRNMCYLKEKEVIDGQGAGRIAQKLLENHI